MENKPLAERMRPKSLEDYIGQQHLVGPGKVLRKMIDSGVVSSFILWGPPGVGKTTLAMIIAEQLKRPFYVLSAVSSGVKDVREVIQKAEGQRFFNTPNPILFIDEIHRFSKAQQDSLLAAVEKGTVTLIGATTENPSFEVISPLLSRCQVYVLKSQEKKDLEDLIDRAVIPIREPVRCAFQRHRDPLHAVVCLILLLPQLLDDGLAALELCHCRGDRLESRGVTVCVVRIGGLAQQGGELPPQVCYGAVNISEAHALTGDGGKLLFHRISKLFCQSAMIGHDGVDGVQNCLLERFLIQCRRVQTVFSAIIQTARAAPYRTFFTMLCPYDTPVSRTAFPAEQQTAERVFAAEFSTARWGAFS